MSHTFNIGDWVKPSKTFRDYYLASQYGGTIRNIIATHALFGIVNDVGDGDSNFAGNLSIRWLNRVGHVYWCSYEQPHDLVKVDGPLTRQEIQDHFTRSNG